MPDPGYVRCMVPPWDRLLSIRWTVQQNRPSTTGRPRAKRHPPQHPIARHRRRDRDRPRDPRPRPGRGATCGRGPAGSRPHRPGAEHAPDQHAPDQHRRDLGHRGRRPARLHRRHVLLAAEHHRQHRRGQPAVPGLLQLPDRADRHRVPARPSAAAASTPSRPRPDGTKLYVAGSFNTVNGVTKRKIASINLTTGAPVAGFTANAGAQATALAATNSTLYVGGNFQTVNGTARVGLVARQRRHRRGRPRLRQQHVRRHRRQRRSSPSSSSSSPTTTPSCWWSTPAARSPTRTATASA